MSFPTSLESRIPRLAPRGPISDFRRTFHLPARQEMFFLIRYSLPTDVNVGLRRLWTQVQNLTKLWILCLYFRIPENNFPRRGRGVRGVWALRLRIEEPQVRPSAPSDFAAFTARLSPASDAWRRRQNGTSPRAARTVARSLYTPDDSESGGVDDVR
jgi:hypothetical protein